MNKKVLTVLSLATFLAGCLIYATVRQATTFAQVSEAFGGNIVLGRPTDRSITVNVLFNANQDSVYLEYGEKSGELTKQTNPQTNIRANQPYEEVIESLQPNLRYFYRVRFRGAGQVGYGASTEHTFQTQRAPGSTFTFTIPIAGLVNAPKSSRV